MAEKSGGMFALLPFSQRRISYLAFSLLKGFLNLVALLFSSYIYCDRNHLISTQLNGQKDFQKNVNDVCAFSANGNGPKWAFGFAQSDLCVCVCRGQDRAVGVYQREYHI